MVCIWVGEELKKLVVFLFTFNKFTTVGHKIKRKLNKRRLKQRLSVGRYFLSIPLIRCTYNYAARTGKGDL